MSVPDFTFITVLVHCLTPCNTALLGKLTVPKLVKKFRTFYGNRKFITSSTRACHLSLSDPHQSSPHPPFCFFKIHFNIILPSTSRSSKSTRILVRIKRNGVRKFRRGFLEGGAQAGGNIFLPGRRVPLTRR
jgi:hypothetical protein